MKFYHFLISRSRFCSYLFDYWVNRFNAFGTPFGRHAFWVTNSSFSSKIITWKTARLVAVSWYSEDGNVPLQPL